MPKTTAIKHIGNADETPSFDKTKTIVEPIYDTKYLKDMEKIGSIDELITALNDVQKTTPINVTKQNAQKIGLFMTGTATRSMIPMRPKTQVVVDENQNFFLLLDISVLEITNTLYTVVDKELKVYSIRKSNTLMFGDAKN